MKKLVGKKQLFIYAMAGLGINMLNLIVGTYLTDALMVEGFSKDIEYWTYANVTLISAAVWSVLVSVAKIIDGFIDIPLAGLTDNFKSRWGRRRPFIFVGLLGVILFYCLFLIPVSKVEGSIGNTIWFFFILAFFYVFYTLTMVTYYSTYSEITKTEDDKLTLSNYKSVFDVIYFVMGYALIPAFVSLHLNIRYIALIFLPLSLTMLIPLFMIKEQSTRPQDVALAFDFSKDAEKEYLDSKFEQVGMLKSIKIVFKNATFVKWMLIFMALQFGLQMFMAGENVFFSGALNFEGYKITLVTACVFAPVPLTLIIYHKLSKKMGFKVGFIYSLLMFILAMIIMTICYKIENDTVRLVLACFGGVVASFGVGAFFSVGYSIPAALAAMDYQKTKVQHGAMYFAVQGLASGVAGAISSGVVWVNLRDNGLVWIMGIVVGVSALVALALTFLLPKELSIFAKASLENKQDNKIVLDKNDITLDMIDDTNELIEDLESKDSSDDE